MLHYTANTAPLQDGDLLLIDAGCSLTDYYNGDITRTFPVNGRFTLSSETCTASCSRRSRRRWRPSSREVAQKPFTPRHFASWWMGLWILVC